MRLGYICGAMLYIFASVAVTVAGDVDYCALSARVMTSSEASLYWKTAACLKIIERPPMVTEVAKKPCPDDAALCCMATEPDERDENGILHGMRGVYEPTCRRIVFPTGCPVTIAHETIHYLLDLTGELADSEAHRSRLFEICGPR